ncbi:urease accessory protein UreE [Epibacterium ulvae]|uniref:urease accessory protein UreE n=1 Tax=Epibacterium ulvae TaxID=1156985 RepID=UPI001BFC3347|nr:urease accessory protein UreE [Epibacterium ulvae]MBT8153195.1 urease accessory protein UreE [Epibacterium ulvae]
MTAPQMIAQTYRDHGHATAIDRVVLDYTGRFLRRKVLTTERDVRLLVDLAQTTSLDHGGVLITQAGDEVQVVAAPESLLEIRATDLTRIAWHIGNRHTPCQIEGDRLLIQHDHVIRDLLTLLGADVAEVVAPFTPEGGAYGHGRTHSHDHGHGPAHEHAHDH